jgi:hypothetical protein
MANPIKNKENRKIIENHPLIGNSLPCSYPSKNTAPVDRLVKAVSEGKLPSTRGSGHTKMELAFSLLVNIDGEDIWLSPWWFDMAVTLDYNQ